MNIRKTTYLGIIFSGAVLSLSIAQAKPPSESVNTLGQLQCSSGEVALFNGIGWVCSDITAITARLDALEAENLALKDRLACVNSASNATKFVFEGCNVHVSNGAGQTDSINGFGNLIVGYDAARGVESDKTGSHNMVIGDGHNYNSYGGLVAGRSNSITGSRSSVTGGWRNTASGDASSVTGGEGNIASGDYSSVTAGEENEAARLWSSVSGGLRNKAAAPVSHISGGTENIANGVQSTVSGGTGCVVDQDLGWGVGGADGLDPGCVTTNAP